MARMPVTSSSSSGKTQDVFLICKGQNGDVGLPEFFDSLLISLKSAALHIRSLYGEEQLLRQPLALAESGHT